MAHLHKASDPVSQCGAGESVFFSCQVGSKIVSLCSIGKSGAIAYRYGPRGKVENEYLAAPDNGNRFQGNVSPASPGASVRQVWFTRDDFKYLLTECVGGDCPRSAGLAVFHGDKVIMNATCARKRDDVAWFSHDMVNFGSDLKTSTSKTDLLHLDDMDNAIEEIYHVSGQGH